MMKCKEVSQQLSQGLDRSLSWQQRMGLRLHLMMCNACRQFAKQLTLLRQAARKVGSRLENDDRIVLSYEARERIGSAFKGQAEKARRIEQDPE